MLCLDRWNLYTSSISRWLSWPSPHMLANRNSRLPWWSFPLVTCRLLLLLLSLVLRWILASSVRQMGKKVTHSVYVPWLMGRFLACLHDSRQTRPDSPWGRLRALDEPWGWRECRSSWFCPIWSYQKVSPRAFLQVSPPSAVPLCSWSVDGHPSPTSQYSTRRRLLNLLTIPLLRTPWGI